MVKKIILLLVLMSTTSYAAIAAEYNVDVDIDFAQRAVSGTVTVMGGGDDIPVYIAGFSDLEVDGKPVRTRAAFVNVSASGGKLKYTKKMSAEDVASDSFLSVGNIIPLPMTQDLMKKTWSVTLPRGFEAVSEADSIAKSGRKFTFIMNKPLERVDIIASSDYKVKKGRAGSTDIYAYFFSEDSGLMNDYLEKTAAYIELYEKLLNSKFPYERFSVVEHIAPHGYATPAYTVLGKSVARLPFILDTSLGHEVLHQWFGCAITLSDGGNFFEALTAYLADHYYTLGKDNGDSYRRNILLNYETYVKNGLEKPLNSFMNNTGKLDQSIGYGKGAMVFHMAMMKVGQKQFYEGLSDFTNKYMFKRASWNDLLATIGVGNGNEFTNYWLNSPTIPDIRVTGASVSIAEGAAALEFTLTRKNGAPHMAVPYTIFYPNGKDEGFLDTIEGVQKFKIRLDNVNAKFVIDNDYDIMRTLTPDESPASIAKMMNADNVLALTSGNACDALFSILPKGVEKRSSDDATFSVFKDRNVLICGYSEPAAKLIAGSRTPNGGTAYEVFHNPFATGKYIMIVENPRPENARLLQHYGRYSQLEFDGARNIRKAEQKTSTGIVVYEKNADKAVETRSVKTFADIVAEASKYPAVFVGERHDSYAHHMNQLELVRRLHESGKKIAIGFEMLQKQFQHVADDFIAGKISEREFLKKAEYFARWGYDYNLYAPLFRYARDNKVDIVALNIDGAINKKISTGMHDNLTESERGALPQELNMVNSGYYNDIRRIFEMHPSSEGSTRSFGDFYAAQNVWDEVMAESVVRYQKKNPDTVVVVIAGSGHSRRDSGIPLRYERLTGKKAYVILQDDELSPDAADAVLETVEINSLGSPKIGVTIIERGDRLHIEDVEKDSPAGKAGIAAKDIFVQCGGTAIEGISDLKYILFTAGYDSNLTCEVLRDGKKKEVTIDVAEWTMQPKSPHGAMKMPPMMMPPEMKDKK